MTLTALVDLPFILMMLTLIAIIGGPLVFVPLLIVPLVTIVSLLAQPALDRLSARAMHHAQLTQAVLVEAIGRLETVKANNAAPLLTARWLAAMEKYSHISLNPRLGSGAINRLRAS